MKYTIKLFIIGLFIFPIHHLLAQNESCYSEDKKIVKNTDPYIFVLEASDCECGNLMRGKGRAFVAFKIYGFYGLFTTLHGVIDCKSLKIRKDINDDEGVYMEHYKVNISKDLAYLMPVKEKENLRKYDFKTNEGLFFSPCPSIENGTMTVFFQPWSDKLGKIQCNISSTDLNFRDVLYCTDDDTIIEFFKERNSPSLKTNVIMLDKSSSGGNSGSPVFPINIEQANGITKYSTCNTVIGYINGSLKKEENATWAIAFDTSNLLPEECVGAELDSIMRLSYKYDLLNFDIVTLSRDKEPWLLFANKIRKLLEYIKQGKNIAASEYHELVSDLYFVTQKKTTPGETYMTEYEKKYPLCYNFIKGHYLLGREGTSSSANRLEHARKLKSIFAFNRTTEDVKMLEKCSITNENIEELITRLLEPLKKEEFDILMDSADFFLSQGLLKESYDTLLLAKKYYLQAVKLFPYNDKPRQQISKIDKTLILFYLNYKTKGDFFERKEKYDSALIAYDKAFSFQPDSMNMVYNKLRVLQKIAFKQQKIIEAKKDIMVKDKIKQIENTLTTIDTRLYPFNQSLPDITYSVKCNNKDIIITYSFGMDGSILNGVIEKSREYINSINSNYPLGQFNYTGATKALNYLRFIVDEFPVKQSDLFLDSVSVTINGHADATPFKSKFNYSSSYDEVLKRFDMNQKSDNEKLAFLRAYYAFEVLSGSPLIHRGNYKINYYAEKHNKGGEFRKVTIIINLVNAFKTVFSKIDNASLYK